MSTQPPAAIDAEKAVLGAVIDARALRYVTRHLDPDDFYRPAHATILEAVLALDARGVEVDPISVLHELEARGDLVRVGGGPYLHDLIRDASGAALGEHVRIVAEAAVRRRLYEAGQRVQQLAAEGDSGDLAAIVDQARVSVDGVAGQHRNADGRGGEWVGALLERRLDSYDDPEPPGVRTGLTDLDAKLAGGRGAQPGWLVVIAARPSVGKSVLGVEFARAAAMAGHAALFSSLEMPREEVADRILANESSVGLDYIARRDLDGVQRANLRAAVRRHDEVPLWIEDAANTSLARLRSAARDLSHHKPPLGIVVADYLQLMTPADERAPREQQVSQLSRGLKVMAKELRVPVVALAQLNRKVEERADKKPLLSDLRESGSVEQDADVVLLLSRPEDQDGVLNIQVAKNRGGPAGDTVQVSWNGRLARVRNLSYRFGEAS